MDLTALEGTRFVINCISKVCYTETKIDFKKQDITENTGREVPGLEEIHFFLTLQKLVCVQTFLTSNLNRTFLATIHQFSYKVKITDMLKDVESIIFSRNPKENTPLYTSVFRFDWVLSFL